MNMGTNQRWLVLILMLGLTLSATALVSQEDPDAALSEAMPVSDTPQKDVVASKEEELPAVLNLQKLQRVAVEEPEIDPFAAKSWYVPPPPPKALPPPPPSAPPLPFGYMGKLIEDGQLTVFLTRQERNYVVKVGDTIDGMYKVEEVRGAAMTLVYLPLNIKQTLMIGGE